MLFLDHTTENEFFLSLKQGIKKNASFNEDLIESKIKKASSYLTYAAICLEQAGFKKEAQMITVLEEACSDPATEGLTPENMLSNLEEKGWVFNDSDEGCSCKKDDCAMCLEGEQPQLSQSELSKLRKILGDESSAMDGDAKEGLTDMFGSMEKEDRKEMLKRLNKDF